MPTLVIVRHAQAESFAETDQQRPLTKAGHGDARQLGRWLAESGVEPDVVYVSSARRTQETVTEIVAAAAWSVAPHTDEGLYGADEQYVLELIGASSDATDTVVVIGHNPTMEILAQLLNDGTGPASADLTPGFPTAAAAVFRIEGAWAAVAPMSGRLERFHVGRR